jgi:hypothetical protein
MLVNKLSEQNAHTRSFLAVKMAFELLDSHRRMYQGAGERMLSIILADIPQRLGDQFDEMLKRSLDREHTWKLLCTILAARRTIKIPELKVIYALTESRGSTIGRAQSYEELELSTDDEEFKQLVRSRCGLFVTFVRNSVHLFHQTAREHLMAKAEIFAETAPTEYVWSPGGRNDNMKLTRGSSWKGCISKADANLVCATVCLDILTFAVSRDWVLET